MDEGEGFTRGQEEGVCDKRERYNEASRIDVKEVDDNGQVKDRTGETESRPSGSLPPLPLS
jgi:hypothetical protein